MSEEIKQDETPDKEPSSSQSQPTPQPAPQPAPQHPDDVSLVGQPNPFAPQTSVENTVEGKSEADEARRAESLAAITDIIEHGSKHDPDHRINILARKFAKNWTDFIEADQSGPLLDHCREALDKEIAGQLSRELAGTEYREVVAVTKLKVDFLKKQCPAVYAQFGASRLTREGTEFVFATYLREKIEGVVVAIYGKSG